MSASLTSTYFFTFLSLFFFSHLTQGQSKNNCRQQLRGHIHCKKDYTPLIGTTVQLVELNLALQANEQGEFEFNNLCEGTYTLQCHFIGYRTHQQQVTIGSTPQKNSLEVYLEHENTELQIVEVQGIRTVSELHTQSTNHLIGKDLDQTKGMVLGEALKKIVGVTTIQTGVSIAKPVIQGLHSNRVLVMNNGVRQEGQQWGAEHAPEIDPFVANQLSVIKGAASVRYGADAIGGVVLVEPKPLTKNKLIGGEVNLVGFSNTQQGIASGIIEGKLQTKKTNLWAAHNHLYWRVQGTAKQAGTVQTPNYYLRNTGFEERNFSYNLGYLKENIGFEVFYSQFNSSIGIFSGSHFGNLSDLNVILAKGSPDSIHRGGFTYDIERPYQRIEHELFKAKAYYKSAKAGKFNLTFARQFNYRAEFDKHFPRGDSLRRNTPQMAFKITTHTLELTWEHLPKKGFYGIVGLNGMLQNNTYSGRFFIPFFRNSTAGIFAIEHYEINRWHLEAGIRFDYRHLEVDLTENRQPADYEFLSYDFNNLSGTIGAKYQLQPHWEVG
ncbi:MAG: TonB-dependent receptor, partial [Thermoflexibacteraceae bacterium]